MQGGQQQQPRQLLHRGVLDVIEQQQPRQLLHRGVLDGIERISNPRYRQKRHQLEVMGYYYAMRGVDRHSFQHLVDFLDDSDSREVVITELEFHWIQLSRMDGSLDHFNVPFEGGLEVICAFFSRSDTTLTRVTMDGCHFATTEDTSQLIAAFETNRTVTDLTIRRIRNLQGVALGDCVSGLLQNMPQLQCLDCSQCIFHLEGVRALQPGLRSSRSLKELFLDSCHIGDEGIGLVADALVGNTMIEILDINGSLLTGDGLDDIARILESTQLQSVTLAENGLAPRNEASMRRFARALSRHAFLNELDLSDCRLGDAGIRIIADGLVGNTTMDILCIGRNGLTSNGLEDILRLVKSTRLKTIDFCTGNFGIFGDENVTQCFVSALQHINPTVQELPGIASDDFPINIREASNASIKNSLTRNKHLNHVDLLLAPPHSPQQQQRNATTMMLKVCHNAIIKFAKVPNNAGASAIFKLFQFRPALLEKRLKRPDAGSERNNSNHTNSHSAIEPSSAAAAAAAATISRREKRQRL